MSDYSFMRSGFSNLVEPPRLSEQDKENLEIMLALFTSNALINAAKYVEYCGRNGVTQMDVLYGLIYEVFEFLNRRDLNEGMEEIREEYYKMYNFSEDDEDYEDEDEDEDGEDDKNYEYEGDGEGEGEDEDDKNIAERDFGELNNMIVPDNEIENFKRIAEEKITSNNMDFVEKIHRYYDNWDSWNPETPLQISLRDAINKIK